MLYATLESHAAAYQSQVYNRRHLIGVSFDQNLSFVGSNI
jgi:hypothetical protein